MIELNDKSIIVTRPGVRQVFTEEVVRKENYAPFSMIGEINRDKEKTEMDIFDKLYSVSKGAYRVFLNIKTQSTGDYNFAVLQELNDLEENQMKVFRRCVAELRKAGLVVRAKNRDPIVKVQKHTYMINPQYLKCWKYAKAQELWSLYNK